MTPRERAEAEACAVFTIEPDAAFDDDEWFSVDDGSGADERVLCGSREAAEAYVTTHAAPIANAIERALQAALVEHAVQENDRIAQAVMAERERGDALLAALREVLAHMPGRAKKMRARVESVIARFAEPAEVPNVRDAFRRPNGRERSLHLYCTGGAGVWCMNEVEWLPRGPMSGRAYCDAHKPLAEWKEGER